MAETDLIRQVREVAQTLEENPSPGDLVAAMTVYRAAEALQRAEEQIAEMREVLQETRLHVAASAQASHLRDGFTIGEDGKPRGRRVDTAEDRLLQRVDAALAAPLPAGDPDGR